jgi:hypothetical protein
MTKRRLVTLLVSLTLTLSMASAVTAQEEDAAWDPVEVPEFQQDEALAAYLLFEEELAASGVPEEDIAAATDWLASEAANLSEKDVEELLAAQMVADREGDDDEFGQAEEDEPELFDDDEEEDGE